MGKELTAKDILRAKEIAKSGIKYRVVMDGVERVFDTEKQALWEAWNYGFFIGPLKVDLIKRGMPFRDLIDVKDLSRGGKLEYFDFKSDKS